MVAEIKAAAKDGDSLGGVVEVLGYGVPVGLGSHVHWDRKLDSLLARALMSIQAVKGVEIGDGFEVAGRRGSEAHDPISWDAESGAYRRESALAGGIEGGISTGEVLVARAAMKPLATLNRPTLKTVDTATKEEAVSFKERTDVTAVPGDGRGRRDDGRARARRRGHPQVRGRLASTSSAATATHSSRRWARSMTGPVVLVGLMGSGKTTVGRRLAALLERDVRRRRRGRRGARPGRPIAEIFADRRRGGLPRPRGGRPRRAARRGHAPAVIASGGGVVLRDGQPRAAAAPTTSPWCGSTAAPAFLASRIERKAHRPLLAGDETPA